MKLIFKIIVLLVAFCNCMKAQKIPDSVLMKKAKLEIYDNPDNTIRIGEQLLKKSQDIKTSINLYMLLSTANIAKRNFEESLQYILKAKELSQKTNDPRSQAGVLISVAIQYQQMELFNKCLETLNEAEQHIAKIPEKNPEKYVETAASYAIRGMVYKSQSNSEIALEKFLISIRNYEKVPVKRTTYSNMSVVYYNIGYCYLNLNQIDNAQEAFLQAINYARKNYAKSLEAFALKGLAEIHKQRHENQSAISLLLKAEDLSKNTGDIILNEGLYKELAENYLAVGQQNLYQQFNKKHLEMRFKRKQNELKSINQVIDNHNKETALKSEKLRSDDRYIKIGSVFLGCILIVLLLYSIVKIRKENKKFHKEIQQMIRTS
ncbi:tetratricopeptide (TPR) repeat protein [Chryseobacterium bernardetii]|uniref:Tetratricopeptide repeat protein n=3 Tax=Chryseobacterium TaxID=59732 RepID=A0A543EMD6_9FLAO|nr:MULTISPECIES: tetratricopeptide repeat protein [Chryseobacterium]MDR6369141.1 tetratricopeptide (TPR) repeat protein [Chryseobacterium vietnamense]MDR6439936.1 tetratricopeptide (TPR) repeat protein [Chryseobacterium bernardetii]TQM22746.1 tetratricopeptide repeat protein [Chryseobacterium aquifrigidense]